MLWLVHSAHPDHCIALTVDHQLRPESASEAAFVATLCAGHRIPHATLTVEVDPGNTQDRAREARYQALERHARAHGIASLLTAHHADDQAETLLMRLNRGSGLMGLSCVRPVRRIDPSLAILRPLLAWRKAELEGICLASGIEPARDPSNEDESFDRVRLRNQLARADWLDPVMLARSAGLLAEASSDLLSEVESVYNQSVSFSEGTCTYEAMDRPLVAVEIVLLIMQKFGAKVSRGQVSTMVERLSLGENASLGGVLASPSLHAHGDTGDSTRLWTFRPEPPRRAS